MLCCALSGQQSPDVPSVHAVQQRVDCRVGVAAPEEEEAEGGREVQQAGQQYVEEVGQPAEQEPSHQPAQPEPGLPFKNEPDSV